MQHFLLIRFSYSNCNNKNVVTYIQSYILTKLHRNIRNISVIPVLYSSTYEYYLLRVILVNNSSN